MSAATHARAFLLPCRAVASSNPSNLEPSTLKTHLQPLEAENIHRIHEVAEASEWPELVFDTERDPAEADEERLLNCLTERHILRGA